MLNKQIVQHALSQQNTSQPDMVEYFDVCDTMGEPEKIMLEEDTHKAHFCLILCVNEALLYSYS